MIQLKKTKTLRVLYYELNINFLIDLLNDPTISFIKRGMQILILYQQYE